MSNTRGTAEQAIDYAANYLADYKMTQFLIDWRNNDLSDWPGYVEYLKKRTE